MGMRNARTVAAPTKEKSSASREPTVGGLRGLLNWAGLNAHPFMRDKSVAPLTICAVS